ncbi:cilia- and flagella-associated protein 300-like [Lineus longissimus]|uniref:cilia- and flagella-associated protein 300-like n=1 Tax=Lineus longissimus TaxID=88925 RepID=UPI002B4CE777
MQSKFSFQHLKSKNFPSIEGKDAQDFLMKWGMKGRIKAQTFSFDQQFQTYQKEDFAKAFFEDPEVQQNLQVVSSGGKWSSFGTKVEKVSIAPVPCTVISMEFFDRLYGEIARQETGHIKKCFDEYVGDTIISDELRKVLLLEESENYELFSEAEREEFLFRIFTHICIGGEVCQFEDFITPYLDMAKAVYKELVSVVKDSETKKLRVISHAFRVTAADAEGDVYPADSDHDQNFSYFIIDPLKRHVTVFYHRFGAGFME